MSLDELFKKEEKPTKQKVTLTLDPEILEMVEKISKKQKTSRSQTVEVLLKLAINTIEGDKSNG